MKYFIIIYTILYIILEIAFRSRFLDAVGVVSTKTSLESIEFIGRFISSLGLGVLIFSHLKLKKIKYMIPSFFSKLIISILLSVVFFHSQKFLIESVSENMSPTFKKNAVLVSLFRDSLYYNKIKDLGNFPYKYEERENYYSKTFLTNIPMGLIGSDKHISFLSKNSELLFSTNIDAVSKNVDIDIAKSTWLHFSVFYNVVWEKYKRLVREVDINSSSKRKYKYFMDKAKEVNNNILSDEYRSFKLYKRGFIEIFASDKYSRKHTLSDYIGSNGTMKNLKKDKNITLKSEYIPTDKYDNIRFTDVDDYIEDIENIFKEWNSYSWSIKNIFREVFAVYGENELRISVSKKMITHYDSKLLALSKKICYQTNASLIADNFLIDADVNSNSQLVFTLQKNKRGVLRVIQAFKFNDKSYKKYVICNPYVVSNDVLNVSKDLGNRLLRDYYKFSGSARSYVEYKRQRFSKLSTVKIAKKYDMVVPYGYDSSNKKMFKKYYIKSLKYKRQEGVNYLMAKVLGVSKKEIVSKYGGVSLVHNEKSFYYSKPMKLFISKNFPFLVEDDGSLSLNYMSHDLVTYSSAKDWYWSHFWSKYTKFKFDKVKLSMDSISSNSTSENSFIVDGYVKSVIIPPFVLFISGLFIILNFINLIWLICNGRFKIIATSIIVVIFFVIPTIIDNEYSEYYKNINQDKSYATYLLIKWIQNVGVIFDKVGFFNDSVNYVIDYSEVKMNFIESTAESRVIIKRKIKKIYN